MSPQLQQVLLDMAPDAAMVATAVFLANLAIYKIKLMHLAIQEEKSLAKSHEWQSEPIRSPIASHISDSVMGSEYSVSAMAISPLGRPFSGDGISRDVAPEIQEDSFVNEWSDSSEHHEDDNAYRDRFY
ncbi:hypothetical protein MASR1M60_19590 [Rhodocyclaceae bacterium]